MAMKQLASVMLEVNPVNLEVLTYLSSELTITIIENMRAISV